ncbi:MAG: ParB/RepB/Spo0J family partition protein [Clostridia bacterium]|nr:ParB/RepB/Spo0J family partition protein [Clostridia bacterium]
MPVFDLFKNNQKHPTSQEEPEQLGKRYAEIDVDEIIPNPNQPRTVFDDDALEELAQSIQQVGLIQPLLVRKTDTGYELVAGERRLRAVKKLGFIKVPCLVQDSMDSEESALMAIIENLQRENLGYMEEAQCYAAMLEKYSLTQEQLAMRLGKSQSCIANKLRLLKLSAPVAEALSEAGLSERHAREIIRLKDEKEQLDAIAIIKERSLSVKDTERYVTKHLDGLFAEGKAPRPRPIIMRVMKDYRAFMNSINNAVEMLRDSGLDVQVTQKDREDGVDIAISVTRHPDVQ